VNADPLSLPPLTDRQLTDYSDDPGFAILPGKAEPMTDFPSVIPAADTDKPRRPWRVVDEAGNATDYPTHERARGAMQDVPGSCAAYVRSWPDGEWLQFETLLRG
jgi:hypothetical protein